MKTVRVIIEGGKIGLASVAHIELAYVIREGNYWKIRYHLASGREVTSNNFDDRNVAENTLSKLFD